MDLERARALRELLAPTGWVDRTRAFATALRKSRAGRDPGGLLIVGTPTHEPWHLTAHLDDEARWFDLPELTPTLIRWEPPAGAPDHLSVGLTRLEQAARGETVMVVAPDQATDPLLERVADARRHGAVVLAVETDNAELESLAHEALIVPADAGEDLVVPMATTDELVIASNPEPPAVAFDVVTHLVSVSASDQLESRRRGVRDRLSRLLDVISGPNTGR